MVHDKCPKCCKMINGPHDCSTKGLVEAIKADWLNTGPWQNFDGYETHSDPYRRILTILEGAALATGTHK